MNEENYIKVFPEDSGTPLTNWYNRLWNLPPDSVIEDIAQKFNVSFRDAMILWEYPDIKIGKPSKEVIH